MRNRESNSFFDQRIMPVLAHFNEADRVRLCKFLFGAFSDTAAKYFRTLNLPESEVEQLVSKEHDNLEAMLLEHLKSVTENEEVDDTIEVRKMGKDDQFVNDALIEMNLLLKEIEGM